MENPIIKFLLKHVSLSEELITIIAQSTVIRSYKKGTVLLSEGDVCREGYFVLKGCVRSYSIVDGEDKTLEFYTEEQPVTIVSYGKGIVADHYLECTEDSVLSISTPEQDEEMFQKYPQFESICRIMSEAMMANFQESFAHYKLTTPEGRYLHLLKSRPDLIQRVPQYQLASYLGITPESLSRLKKRLIKK